MMNTGQASPITVLDQQVVQIRESLRRCTWRAQGQGSTDGRVQHPAGDCNDDAMGNLYVDEFTRGTALAIHAAQSAAIQRVPPVEDFNFLPDMGRMNRNWRLEDRTGCSPAACAPASELRPS